MKDNAAVHLCPVASLSLTKVALNPLHPDHRNTIADFSIGLGFARELRWHETGEIIGGGIHAHHLTIENSVYSPDYANYGSTEIFGSVAWRRIFTKVAFTMPFGLVSPTVPNEDLVVPFGSENHEISVSIALGLILGPQMRR